MEPKKPFLIKLAIGFSGFLIFSYLGISAYAVNTLSKPNRCFDPQAKSVFTVLPEDVKFRTEDNIAIAGWFIRNQSNDKVIILVHGLNSSRTCEFDGKFTEFASAMNQKGFSILAIDQRGHGQSDDARFTFGITEKRDVIAAVEWLKAKGFKSKKIGVLGVSMGSATVLSAAANDPDIGAVVTDSGYAEVYPIIQQHWQSASGLPEIFLPSTMMFGNLLTGQDLTSSRPVKEISRISPRPILIIHSVIDPYTPIQNALHLREAYPASEYWETNAKNHAESYNTNPKLYVEKVTNFFNRSLN